MAAKVEIIKRPVEQVGSDIKKSAWSSVGESLALLILGILFIVWPDTMIRIVSYIVGAIFIIKGAFQIINYFLEKGQNDFFNNGLLIGVVSALIGIAALVIGEDLVNIFRIVIGIFIIYESLARINTAIKLHAAGINVWRYVLLLALIVLILGILVTFNDAGTIIGWVMVASGLIGIVGDIIFIQQVNNIVSKLAK